jgi:hypothetical protein
MRLFRALLAAGVLTLAAAGCGSVPQHVACGQGSRAVSTMDIASFWPPRWQETIGGEGASQQLSQRRAFSLSAG